MFKTLFIHELQNYLYSLRFQISFIIAILVFAFGTASYIVSIKDTHDNYAKFLQDRQKQLEEKAKNASKLATDMDNYVLSPNSYAIIDDCKESILPNKFTYNAYNVYSFDVRSGSVNPLLKKAQGLNWAFIMSMILSFMTLLLAFDAISGEKEDRTLSLIFSNKVPRGTFIFSKFLSIVTTIFSITIIGIILSLLIVLASGKININARFLFEMSDFLLISLLFIAVMAIIGLLASTLTRQSNISLLTCLTIWIVFAVVLPNSSLFFAKKIFGIPSANEVQKTTNQELQDINRNAPPGSWSANGGNPFYPRHELRANNQTNLMNARKRHYDAYYNQMFHQFESTRRLSIFSPITQFQCLNEGILGGGYLRFQKNWNDLHSYQESFLQWFKDLDAKDKNSPHWYNPYESLSTTKQSVSLDQIPQYSEKPAALVERLTYMKGYLIAMIVTLGAVFAFCFVRFLRYDVR
ncbi:MAG: ABC transporter permease [Prevotellaceae bacterium]|jgi:ABC-type transport system involved in multi-copper enzyme maturation permease subunit|nr:ABC transporter permease [Prevotellaceae bacterium]